MTTASKKDGKGRGKKDGHKDSKYSKLTFGITKRRRVSKLKLRKEIERVDLNSINSLTKENREANEYDTINDTHTKKMKQFKEQTKTDIRVITNNIIVRQK